MIYQTFMNFIHRILLLSLFLKITNSLPTAPCFQPLAVAPAGPHPNICQLGWPARRPGTQFVCRHFVVDYWVG